MYNDIIGDTEKCYGCGACVSICPKKCLSQYKDKNGFNQVKIEKTDSCISCGLCKSVCPAIQNNDIETDSKYYKRYYSQNHDDDILNSSSSGGVFSALADKVFSLNGVVWGVKIEKNGQCSFSCARNSTQLKELRGSKYVEVENGIPFEEIENQLKNEPLVMVTGTPCQIKALRKYFNDKHFDNLLLVDLLCYGVQSPKIWMKYLSEINPKGKELTSISMRYKKPSWENYSMRLTFSDNSKYSASRWKDPYLLSYATNLYNRKSCSNCIAKNFPRYSDITIGDFWQVDTLPTINRNIDIKKGVSVIITHNIFGDDFLQSCKESILIFEIPKIVFNNMVERYSEKCKQNKNRNKFENLISTISFANTIKETVVISKKSKYRFKWLTLKRIIKYKLLKRN